MPVDERDIAKAPLSPGEVRALIGERDLAPFLNTRNELYRSRGMKTQPPTCEEAIALMAEHPNLIKRPLLVTDDHVVFGFDPEAYERVLR